ncbi:hypothetical protein C8R43DRAFT_948728 [Mycena crocata]|nr:hypothetical protein C8R43DRAFT_948728 [Mycena crocata]
MVFHRKVVFKKWAIFGTWIHVHASWLCENHVFYGFFVAIGGFVSLDGHPVATKTQLEHPLAGPEISGRSKENTISKAVTLTQAMWFIVQPGSVTEYGHQSGVPFVNVQASFYASDLLGPSNIRSLKIAERRVSHGRCRNTLNRVGVAGEHGIANPPDVGLARLKIKAAVSGRGSSARAASEMTRIKVCGVRSTTRQLLQAKEGGETLGIMMLARSSLTSNPVLPSRLIVQ